MKYLIFNAAVVAALGYIFLGDGNFEMKEVTEPVAQAVERITKTEPAKAAPAPEITTAPVKAVREELSDEEKFILYGEKPASRADMTAAKQVATPSAKETKVAALQPPPLPAAIEVAKKPALPPVTQEAPLHQTVTETGPMEGTSETIAASPVNQEERRKNLRRLVADMERVFAEKLTQ